MIAIQKLVRNGNATQVTIARPILIHLGWRPGDLVEVHLLEDGRLLIQPMRQIQTASLGSHTVIKPAPPTLLP